VTTPAVTQYSAAARHECLPICSFHRQITWTLGFVFFFELGDLDTFAYAAPAILKAWHLSISEISVVVSATFFGMFLDRSGGNSDDCLRGPFLHSSRPLGLAASIRLGITRSPGGDFRFAS
jgi:hypothetical protein